MPGTLVGPGDTQKAVQKKWFNKRALGNINESKVLELCNYRI